MFCAISGHAPEHPVASKKTGHVFERRLAEKYVAETGRCPVTGEPLSADDLLPLVPAVAGGAANGANGGAAAAAPPRHPPAAASVPGLISLLRDEWDASALEAHSLRAQLHAARQELAHALYQHDAACRVIARLLRERDEARAALEAGGAPRGVGGEQNGGQAAAAAATAPNKRARPDDDGGAAAAPSTTQHLPERVAADVTAVSAELQKARRARQPPAALPPADAIAALAPGAAHALHATRPAGGVLCVAARGDVVASGGADGAVGLLDLASGRALPGAPLKAAGGGGKKGSGASGPVSAVAFCSDACVLSCAPAERAVRVWRVGDDGEGWACALTLAVGGDEEAGLGGGGGKGKGGKAAAAAAASAVVGVAAHPSGRYALSATADGGWQTWDLSTGEMLRAVAPPSGSSSEAAPCTGVAMHPDGLIVATLQGDKVLLWELCSGACAAALPPPAVAGGDAAAAGPDVAATCLSFSENGYHLAVGAADGRVRVWDLRKSKLVRTLEAFSGGEGGGGGGGEGSFGAPVTGVSFDPSGSYLAASGREGGVKVYAASKGADWRELGSWPAGVVAKKAAHGVAWARDARALLIAGSDHNVRVLEAPEAAAG